MSIDASLAEKLRDSFARQSMMAHLGVQMGTLGPGTCELHAELTPDVLQQHGFAHAGLTFAMGDSAAGYAALSLMDSDREVLTVEMKINLMAPARGPALIARGRVIKPGRRLMVVTADVFSKDADGERQVALLQGTMIPV